jgi:hypothetical protein
MGDDGTPSPEEAAEAGLNLSRGTSLASSFAVTCCVRAASASACETMPSVAVTTTRHNDAGADNHSPRDEGT